MPSSIGSSAGRPTTTRWRGLAQTLVFGSLLVASIGTPAAKAAAEDAPLKLPTSERVDPFLAVDFALPGILHDWVELPTLAGSSALFFLIGDGEDDSVEVRSIAVGSDGVQIEADESQSESDPTEKEPVENTAEGTADGTVKPTWKALYRLSPDRKQLTKVSLELPASTERLSAVDVDGDGLAELFVKSDDELWQVERPHSLRPEARQLFHYGVHALDRPVDVADPLEAGFASLEFGAVALHNGQTKTRIGLPRKAERTRTGLLITSPDATVVEDADGELMVAAGPEQVGPRRLRTTLIRADGTNPQEGAEPGEDRFAWAALPRNESLEHFEFFRMDGQLRLAAFTQSGDKLGVFERQFLRIFKVTGNRTRAGEAPLLEHQTASYRWHQPSLLVSDLDGDGNEDLSVLEPDGLGGGKLQLRVFPGKGEGLFTGKSLMSKMERPGESALLVKDFNSSGQPGLVVPHDGQLLVWEVRPVGKQVISRKPDFVLLGSGFDSRAARKIQKMPGALTFPTTEGLNFDALDELVNGQELMFRTPQDGRTAIRVLRWK